MAQSPTTIEIGHWSLKQKFRKSNRQQSHTGGVQLEHIPLDERSRFLLPISFYFSSPADYNRELEIAEASSEKAYGKKIPWDLLQCRGPPELANKRFPTVRIGLFTWPALIDAVAVSTFRRVHCVWSESRLFRSYGEFLDLWAE